MLESFERVYLGSRAPRRFLYQHDRVANTSGVVARCICIDEAGCWFVPDHVTTPTAMSDDVEGLFLMETSDVIAALVSGEWTFAKQY